MVQHQMTNNWILFRGRVKIHIAIYQPWSAQKSVDNTFETISDGSAAAGFVVPEDASVLVNGSSCIYILRRVYNTKKLAGGIGKQIDFPFITRC